MPALLALDWGTSSLRAYLMGANAKVLQVRNSAHGLQALPASGRAGFEMAFSDIAGDWLTRWPQLPVVAGGMVGSMLGWKEAPYVRCPADVSKLAEHSVNVFGTETVQIFIAPGVLLDEPGMAPDVLRGEEIQIAGALADDSTLGHRTTMVLPGTHSKWVQVQDSRIVSFATYMTGEMFALLVDHSILGSLMADLAQPETQSAEASFLQGLQEARKSRPGDFSHQIFSVRTLALTQRLPRHLLKDYLSGLLIGHELMSGLAKFAAELKTQDPLVLIGEGSLCRRYALAFDAFGFVTTTIDNPAPRGLWEFASALNLLGAPTQELNA